jgi:hypothetical protein
MKNTLENITFDIDIVIEAINQGDTNDAIKMLLDIKEDLKIITLMC